MYLYILPTFVYIPSTSPQKTEYILDVIWIHLNNFQSVSAWGCGSTCVHVEVCNLAHILFKFCTRVNFYPEWYHHFMISFSYFFPPPSYLIEPLGGKEKSKIISFCTLFGSSTTCYDCHLACFLSECSTNYNSCLWK